MAPARRTVAALVTAALAAASAVTSGAGPLALPDDTRAITHPRAIKSYPVFDPAGNPAGTAAWRVVSGTTTSFENYLAVTATGRLLNYGGAQLEFTDNRGETGRWTEVRGGRVPYLGAEGTVAVAPGGDIVGVTWDPYSGDRVLAVKYDAARDQWLTEPVPLHTPFYDRPWLGVIPGPINVAGQTFPYAVAIKGGSPTKELFMLSLDGLSYYVPSSKAAEVRVRPATTRYLDLPADPETEVFVAHTGTSMTSLPGGGLLSRPDFPDSRCPWYILATDLTWSCLALPGGGEFARGSLIVDSAGHLHDVVVRTRARNFTYRFSSDGGRSWSETVVNLPPNHVVDAIGGGNGDYRVNAALGVGAVTVHAHDNVAGTDRDIVYKFSVGAGAPVLQKVMYVGNGDLDFAGDFGSGGFGLRFDFTSLALFADGKVAVSFVDAAHTSPAVAIEL